MRRSSSFALHRLVWVSRSTCVVLFCAACRADKPAVGDSTIARMPETAVTVAVTPPPDTMAYSADTLATILSMRARIDSSLTSMKSEERRVAREASEQADLLVYTDEHGPRKIIRRNCKTTAEYCRIESAYYAEGRAIVVSVWLDIAAPPAPSHKREWEGDYVFVGNRLLGRIGSPGLDPFSLPSQQDIAQAYLVRATDAQRRATEVVPPPHVPAADPSTVYLQPADFAAMPPIVRQTLEQRGCTIPQEHRGDPHNAFAGSFTGAGTAEWAVLCSVNAISQILFVDVATGAVSDSTRQSADENWVQGAGGGRVEFSRHITLLPLADIRAWRTDTEGHPIPQPMDHDAINQAFSGKYSEGLYRGKGRWFRVLRGD